MAAGRPDNPAVPDVAIPGTIPPQPNLSPARAARRGRVRSELLLLVSPWGNIALRQRGSIE